MRWGTSVRGSNGWRGMNEDQADAASLDQNVFLIGRPPLEEFLGFVATLSPEGEAVDLGGLTAQWRLANDHVKKLELEEAGHADNPPVDELPSSLNQLARGIFADPVFQRSFQLVPTSVGLVELDRLVVFQKHINLNFIEDLKRALGAEPSDAELLSFCLPTRPSLPPVRRLRVAQNAWTFVSASTDLRFLEPVLFEPTQITGYRPSGRVAVVGLVVGYGSNYLNALKVGGRLILNNGSHRAYALRDIGIRKAPCVIQDVTRREELPVVASSEVVAHPERYTEAPRPPMLKDYFDERLRQIMQVPRRKRQVRTAFSAEQTDLPA